MNQVAVGFDRGVWRQKAQASVPRVLAGAAAVVLTVAAFLYVRIALASAAQGSAMALRTRFVLVVLILSATSTCLLAIRPSGQVVTVRHQCLERIQLDLDLQLRWLSAPV